MSDNAKLTFAAGRLIAREKAPYMRALLLGFAPIETPGLGTIGVTEHAVLMVDWAFIDQVTAEEMAGLLIHECMHILLKHASRAHRAGRDVRIDNIAADMAINPSIWDMGLKLPGGNAKQTVEHPLHGKYPEDYGWARGLTTDEYYEKLRQLPQHQQPQRIVISVKGAGGQGTGEDGEGGEGAPQDPNDASGEGGSGGDAAHSKPGQGGGAADKPKTAGGWCGSCAGNPMPGEPDQKHKASRSENEMHRISRAVAEAVLEASSGPDRGTVPSFMKRWAEQILTPAEIPWQKELAVVTRAACAWRENAVDHRYDAPSRRQAGVGYGVGKPVLPRFRQPVPNVAVILDTSGSMGSQEMGEACREVNGILKTIGAEVSFCTCDASVNGISKVRNVKEALARLHGGGGTDMAPGFAAVMKQRPRPEVVICLTDLCIGDPGPKPVGAKVIWVAVGQYAQSAPDPPWGKTIRTDSAKGKKPVAAVADADEGY